MASLIRNPVKVVFVTTVFEGVDTGPGTYARYLWSTFRDDPEIEFHLVAPDVPERHTRLHSSGTRPGSLGLYKAVQETGLKLAAELGTSTIVHGNNTHSMGKFVGYVGPLIVQVNDYDTAIVPERMLSILAERGPRRLASSAWRRWQERRVLQNATLALCNSAYTEHVIRHAYGLPEGKTKVVYKAVDTSVFERPACMPEDPMPGVAKGSRLLFVGADWRRKGLDVLLDAVRQLSTVMTDLCVTVIGPSENDAQLSTLISGYGLGSRVHLAGRLPVHEVARHLWYSDAFVLPSRREALGVAVLEAMAAGVPVIATEVGGIPEIIRSESEGLLVAPDCARSVAAAIVKLLGNTQYRESIAGVGRSRAMHFSVAATTQILRKTYLEVVQTDH